jgi:osmotically-inducible protein OsmY
VNAVVNDINVHAQKVARQTVADAIRQALERHAHRDAERIELEVKDGTVTMTGKVHSWAERTAAIGAAWGTRGVEAVVDRLRIEP